MAPRLARALLLLALAIPPGLRALAACRGPAAACQVEGRGEPPRHWLGCAADPGPPRGLAGEERLLLRRPLDPNTAAPRHLAFVPGLTRRLAEAIAEDRQLHGPYGALEDLRRVGGIGPKRLEQARASLAVSVP